MPGSALRSGSLAHQNRTTAASDFRVDGARSPEFPQKEGAWGSDIAAGNRKSLATFHRTLKYKGSSPEVAGWPLRDPLRGRLRDPKTSQTSQARRPYWATPIGTRKRGHYERGVFSLTKSLKSLNSPESLENGRNLLYFPQFGKSLKTLESLNSLESLERKWTFLKRPLFQKTPFSDPEPKPSHNKPSHPHVPFWAILLSEGFRGSVRAIPSQEPATLVLKRRMGVRGSTQGPPLGGQIPPNLN